MSTRDAAKNCAGSKLVPSASTYLGEVRPHASRAQVIHRRSVDRCPRRPAPRVPPACRGASARRHPEGGFVDVIKVDGLLDPIMVNFIEQSIGQAEHDDARWLVLQTNTTGSVVSGPDLTRLLDRMATAAVPDRGVGRAERLRSSSTSRRGWPSSPTSSGWRRAPASATGPRATAPSTSSCPVASHRDRPRPSRSTPTRRRISVSRRVTRRRSVSSS